MDATYTLWRTRVLAFLVDWIPIWLIVFVPLIGAALTDGATTSADLWLKVQVLSLVPAAVYFLWNFCYRQGRTGQSIGKSVLKFEVVSERTGEPIGFWMSLVRQVAHYVDQTICYLGYLWPLWDGKRQTLADKILGTICVPTSARDLGPKKTVRIAGSHHS